LSGGLLCVIILVIIPFFNHKKEGRS
jgi:hypothetical protein